VGAPILGQEEEVEEILVRGQEALGEMPRAREEEAVAVLLREQERS
jgi:hypothetical protein